MSSYLEQLQDSLIVSCQPVPGGPMDNASIVTAYAQAALDSGASGLRIESVAYVRAVRAITPKPLIGIIKRDLEDSPVRITPLLDDVDALAEADIIAFDGTIRQPRPCSVPDLIARIHHHGKLAMADCATIEDAREALAAGADLVGSTLSGYTGGPELTEPDFALIAKMRALTRYVVAEGNVRTPDHAVRAIKAGAYTVVVGSAITRPEHVTAWFKSAIVEQSANRNDEPSS